MTVVAVELSVIMEQVIEYCYIISIFVITAHAYLFSVLFYDITTDVVC